MDIELLQDMFYAAPEFWYGLGGAVAVLLIAGILLLFSYLRLRQQNYFLRRDRERYAETLYASRDGYFAFIYPDDRINDPRDTITERCSRRLAVILSLENGTKSSFNDVLKSFYKDDGKKIEKYVALLKQEGFAFEDYFELKNSDKIIRLEGARINGADGSIYCDMIWFRDVSETNGRIRLLEKENEKIDAQYVGLRNMIDNLPIPLWLRNSNLDIVDCNKRYIELAGCKSKTEVISQQVEIYNSSGNSISKELAREAFAAQKSFKSRGGIIVGGERIAVEAEEIPFYAENNLTEPYCAGYMTNIDELDELQRTQKQHQEAQLMILGSLGTAFAVFDQATNLKFYNRAFVELWGLEKGIQLDGLSYTAFLDAIRENRHLPEVPDYKSFRKEELKIFSRIIEPLSDLLHLPDGKTFRRTRAPYPMGGAIFAYEDISDRLATTTAYNQLLTVQNEMLNNVSDAVLIFSVGGQLIFFNDAYVKLWKAKREFLLSEPAFDEIIESQKSFFDTLGDWNNLKKGISENILNVATRTLSLQRNSGESLQVNIGHLSDGSLMIVYQNKVD